MQDDFRVGGWVVHPTINALERDDETIHLEPKVMQVLLTLAKEPGEVVTRERVRNAVWPDVFVGEDVLVRAISELRRAFTDDPRSPHTIQTVPKVGYRLIAPVTSQKREATLSAIEPVEIPPVAPSVSESVATFETTELASRDVPVTVSEKRSRRPWVVWASVATVVLVVAAAVAGLLYWQLSRVAAPAGAYTSRPLTTYPGSQLQAAFSPDGSTVAFVWRKQDEQSGHIYIKSVTSAKFVTSEAPVRLTSGDADETSPAWSPNGHFLAFISHAARTMVEVIPSIGGSAQEIYELPANNVWEYGGVAWSADGNELIFPRMSGTQASSQLIELNLRDHSLRTLTTPPVGWDGDWTPTVSPDGTKLAFVRGPDRSSRDLYVMSLPNGATKQLTHDGVLIVGLTWTDDSSSIVFASNRGGRLSLWRLPAGGVNPEHEPAGGDDAYGPSIAREGKRMVYSHGSARWSILSVAIGGRSGDEAAEILTSSEQDASPHVSPDGASIVFQSWRSGAQEIWMANLDGSNPVQLTSAGGSAGSPSGSPDGKLIAFDARPHSFAHVFMMDAAGGSLRAVTSGNFNDIAPGWSADGKWLLFGSNRSGSWQIWKIAADGSGAPQQVTNNGGMIAAEAKDGHSIFYTKFDEQGIWQMSLESGAEHMVTDGPPTAYPAYWAVAAGKLYTLRERAGHPTVVKVDPATERTQVVYTLKHSPTPFAGLSVTPDGKRLIVAELMEASSGLMLVERFQ